VADEFGGDEQVRIVVELAPESIDSKYGSDIRDYEIISYIDKLTQKSDISVMSKVLRAFLR
jgi:hypothetical protein